MIPMPCNCLFYPNLFIRKANFMHFQAYHNYHRNSPNLFLTILQQQQQQQPYINTLMRIVTRYIVIDNDSYLA
jgi:hypothetical protein